VCVLLTYLRFIAIYSHSLVCTDNL